MDQIQGPQQWLLLLFDEYEWREQEVVQLILRFEAILVLGFGIVAPSIGEEDADGHPRNPINLMRRLL